MSDQINDQTDRRDSHFVNLLRINITSTYPFFNLTNIISPNFVPFVRRGEGGTILIQVTGNREINILANDVVPIDRILGLAVPYRTVTAEQGSQNKENEPI